MLGVPQSGVKLPQVRYPLRIYSSVLVGDRSKVEKGIRDLNLGTLTVLSVEDVLGKKPVLE